MRGPPPEPIALKELKGTTKASRHRDKNAPRPEGKAPTCPSWLPKLAKAEWRRLAAGLQRLGLLTTADRAIMAAYCVEYARWVEAERHVADNGEVIKAPSGYPIQNPWLAISRKAQANIRGYAQDLGLTPAARTRIHVADAPADRPDPMELLLCSTNPKPTTPKPLSAP